MSNNSHNMSGTSEHNTWQQMKHRCFNPNHKRYADWGGRGITVCDRWKNSFEDFLADMGSRPSSKHSLDRIDNDGDYCPENCKWSPRVEQANNKRNNRLITIGCVTLNLKQWTTEMGFGEKVIFDRLKSGWSESNAVLTPVHNARLIKIDSKTYTIAEWTIKMGFKQNVIYDRLKDGWSERNAVLTPVRKKL